MIFQPFGPNSDFILALIVLGASWLLLRFEGKGLEVLGFDQAARRSKEFLVGMGVTSGAVALVQALGAWLLQLEWQWSADFVLADFVRLTLLPLITKVLVVALIFVGYLLLQALRFAGRTAGLWIAAVVFGLYDCYALDAFNDAGEMVGIFLTASAYGWLLALAFRQTGSLFAPMGLNFGWHFANKAVFGGAVPMLERVDLPFADFLSRAGSAAAMAIYIIVMLAVLGGYAWWLLRKDRLKGNSEHGIQTVRTES
jgi:membrane protease YdiL (CAAX protease family)